MYEYMNTVYYTVPGYGIMYHGWTAEIQMADDNDSLCSFARLRVCVYSMQYAEWYYYDT